MPSQAVPGGPTVRQLWMLLEPLHAVLYYSPAVRTAAADLGYDVSTRWPAYFAWRASPLGDAGPGLVASTFYSFSPRMVEQHVPAAWRVAPAQRVVEARWAAMDQAFAALLGDRLGDDALVRAAGLARTAAEAAGCAGRPLAAANASLPWPDEPHLVLWQAATVLREHRGDGHVTALLTAGLDPCEALVSFAGVGAAPRSTFASRGWTDDEWDAAAARLVDRGLLDSDGTATPAGAALRDDVEAQTDRLAVGPWAALGPQQTGQLAGLLAPLTGAVVASGLLPTTSTLGMRRPGAAT